MSGDATLERFRKAEKLVFPENPFFSEIIQKYQEVIQWYEDRYPNGTPFVVACELGDVVSIEIIIRASQVAGMDVTMVNEEGRNSYGTSYTPLMVAASNEHSAVVKILLDKNADVATTDQRGRNALHIAAYSNKTNTTTVELLLNKMKLEDINHKNKDGFTPLDMCYEYNNSSIQQELIDLIRLKGGKRASELRKRASNSNANDTVTKRQRKLYLTLSNLKF